MTEFEQVNFDCVTINNQTLKELGDKITAGLASEDEESYFNLLTE